MATVLEERGMKVIINNYEDPMLVHCFRDDEEVVINLLGSKVVELNQVRSAVTVALALKIVGDNYEQLFEDWHEVTSRFPE